MFGISGKGDFGIVGIVLSSMIWELIEYALDELLQRRVAVSNSEGMPMGSVLED